MEEDVKLCRNYGRRCRVLIAVLRIISGEGGIQTPGTCNSTPDFESGTFDHSDTSPYKILNKKSRLCGMIHFLGGELGIRTPGTFNSSTVFKTAAIDHSASSPGSKVQNRAELANLILLFFNNEIMLAKCLMVS